MKKKYFGISAILLSIFLAALGIILRRYLVGTVLDETGLIPVGNHLSAVTAWLLLGGLAVVGALTYTLENRPKFSQNFVSLRSKHAVDARRYAWLYVISAVLLAISMISQLKSAQMPLQKTAAILGLVGTVLLLYFAWLQATGKRPNFLMLLPLNLYTILQLIMDYQNWSGDPHLFRYAYIMLSDVAGMLVLFHWGGFCLNLGKRRITAFFSCAAITFYAIAGADAVYAQEYATPYLGLLMLCAVIAAQVCGLSEALTVPENILLDSDQNLQNP